MSDWLDKLRRTYARLAIPTIWVAYALSLVFHAAVLWGWTPHDRDPSLEPDERSKGGGPLVLQLGPEPSRATSPPPSPLPVPAVPAPAARRCCR